MATDSLYRFVLFGKHVGSVSTVKCCADTGYRMLSFLLGLSPQVTFAH